MYIFRLALVFMLTGFMLTGTLAQDTSAPDTDLDGISDADEINIYNTNPQIADTDGDTLVDGVEVTVYGTDPLVADTTPAQTVILASGNPTRLDSIGIARSGDGQAIMSGDGNYVMYMSFDGSYHMLDIYDRSTGATDTIFSYTPADTEFDHISLYRAGISDDGRYGMFATDQNVEQCPNSGQISDTTIYVIDRQTRITSEVMRGPSYGMWGRITGDGSTVLISLLNFASVDACNGEWTYAPIANQEIYTYDVVSGQLTSIPVGHSIPQNELAGSVTVAATSDEGETLILRVNKGQTEIYRDFVYSISEYYLFNRNSGTLKRMQDAPRYITSMLISGNGSTVVATSLYSLELYIYDVASDKWTTVTFPESPELKHMGEVIGVSADGNKTLFSNTRRWMQSERHFDYLFVYDHNASTVIQVPVPNSYVDRLIGDGISSDGTQILFAVETCEGHTGCTNYEPSCQTFPCAPLQGVPPLESRVETYVYDTRAPETVQTFLPSGQETVTQAVGWSRFQWQHLDGAQWYHVVISDYAGYTFNQWVEAAAVCSGGICSLPNDLWLGNGSYHWWMGYWTPGYVNYANTYAETVFTVNVAAPGMVERLSSEVLQITSAEAASARAALTWRADPAMSWYRLYVGDAQTMLHDQWYRADQVCINGVCTAEVELPVGTYDWWMSGWGPYGMAPWNNAAMSVSVSE